MGAETLQNHTSDPPNKVCYGNTILVATHHPDVTVKHSCSPVNPLHLALATADLSGSLFSVEEATT